MLYKLIEYSPEVQVICRDSKEQWPAYRRIISLLCSWRKRMCWDILSCFRLGISHCWVRENRWQAIGKESHQYVYLTFSFDIETVPNKVNSLLSYNQRVQKSSSGNPEIEETHFLKNVCKEEKGNVTGKVLRQEKMVNDLRRQIWIRLKEKIMILWTARK